MSDFQDPSFLSDLYGSEDHIPSRGAFLKTYSNRTFSIRDLITRLLGQPKNQRILDIGAGDCSYVRRLASVFPENSFAALDIVEHPACRTCPTIDYRLYDGNAFPTYGHPFDMVLLMHMLYHVNDHHRFFQEVKRLAAERHTLFITTKSQGTFPQMECLFQEILAGNPHIARYFRVAQQRDEAHFCSENGEAILREHFAVHDYAVKCYHLVTQIIVDVPQTVCDYVLSTPRYRLQDQVSASVVAEYQQLWLRALSKDDLFLDTYKETLYVITTITH